MRERVRSERADPVADAGARRAARAPVPSGPGATRVEGFRALQRFAGNRALARRLLPAPPRSGRPSVQRVVLRGAGDRQHNVDLVNTVIGFQDFGVTPGRINAEEFPGGNPANAIVGPQLTAAPAANGQTAVQVTGEPVNVVDYRMELPAAPPWTRAMNKSQAIPYVEMVAGGGYADELQPLRDDPTEASTFRVAGAPNDGAFAGLVETHEDHHVDDLWAITDDVLEPWDANLRQLREAEAPIAAADEATAREALYAAAGGTPAEIGQQLLDEMRDRGTAFHQTPAGGPPVVDDVDAETGPNRLTLTWRHPLG